MNYTTPLLLKFIQSIPNSSQDLSVSIFAIRRAIEAFIIQILIIYIK